jgi:hypothetical protein
LIAPFEEHRSRPRVVERLDREVAEGALDALYLLDVVKARARLDAEFKFTALLEGEQ